MSETVTIKEAAKRIQTLGQRLGMATVFNPAAVSFAEGAIRRLVRGIGPDGTPHKVRSALTASIAGSPHPGRDSGKLQKSIHGFATTGEWGKGQGGKGSVWLIWGSPYAYALTYDQGATITPNPPRRMLAVPLTAEAKRFKSPWDYARAHQIELHCFPLGRRERPRSLVEFTPDGVIPVYALLTKAVIPARPFLHFDKADLANFWRYVRTVTEDSLRGKRGA